MQLIEGTIVNGIAHCAAKFCLGVGLQLIPPPQYDHQPRLMPIIARVHFVEMNFACQQKLGQKYIPGETRTRACALSGPNGHCLIFLPFTEEIGSVAERALWRHERAHCNGWKHKD